MKMNLKAARVNKGYTQSQAAILLGVSKSTISNWERFRSYPDASHIQRIENIYDIKYDELIFLPSNNALSVLNSTQRNILEDPTSQTTAS